ncbi:hypothetical protein Pla52n_70520 [Stieleria varia]|uniref:Uncharacterized protein n=1 Tax=Stieleria varia TaxID=2528005 RepID=A0A5C5ZIP4_9BACT|nr:hypothetical protein Pla52n_70520 [Stieleria varia]
METTMASLGQRRRYPTDFMKTCTLLLIASMLLTGCDSPAAHSSSKRAAPELVGVTIKTSWTKSTHRLALAPDSPFTKFTESYSSTSDSNLSPSVSVAYVGSVSLKNSFAPESTIAGDLIAVRVSIFDQSTKKTVHSETNYKLYNQSELVLYQNDMHGLTITASPHDFDAPEDGG